MSTRIRVLLAEDHRIVREGIRLILEGQDDIQVVGEASTGAEVVRAARELRPDVVIMDIGMPELNGLEATRRIREELPETQVVALTVHEADDYFFRMLHAGASSYVLKGAPSSELVQAVRAASRGEVFLHPAMATRLVGDYLRRARRGEAAEGYAALTEREREVLILLAEGKTNQEIAQMLGISPSTVETHRSHVMEKLSLRNRADLIKYAIREGLIDPSI